MNIRFKNIPKEPIILEEKFSSEDAVNIFKQALENDFLQEVEFKVKNNKNNENQVNTKKVRLGRMQKQVLEYLKEHDNERFSAKEIADDITDMEEPESERVLSSLYRKDLIKRTAESGIYEYFWTKKE